MCGIAGIFCLKHQIPDKKCLIEKMLSGIIHRGPDEAGIYIDHKICLGHVRLSILDLKTGQQPMISQNENLAIVYNGEIFNYSEIKRELVKRGYQFKTSSDTEVLLNAYQEYGINCLNMLNGQFAFAIWNRSKEELFLARDRVGIRPLFYSWKNEELIFASEIKAILEHPGIKAELDPIALSQVFTIWTTLTPRTVFRSIQELQPGHYMIVKGSGSSIKKFWSMSFNDNIYKGAFTEALDELDYLLTDATRIRLRADVTVAAYLSGGIDSSATTSLIMKTVPESFQTFSIGFEEAEFDETPYQKEVSAYLNTKHTAFTCSNDDIGRYFPDVIWHTETPVLRTAPVPMMCLAQQVRDKGIKVVITGEGSDELLGGYDIFREALIRDFWSKQPDSTIRPMLFNKLYPYLAQFKNKRMSALRLFYGYKLKETDSPFYSHLLRWHNSSSLINYFHEDYRHNFVDYDIYSDLGKMLPPGFNNFGRLGKAQWLEIFIFMAGYLLSSQGDRMAMAHSVEGRYPFLDYRVIEFASKLPPDFKIKGLNEKYILKTMMAGRLPESVLKRPKQAYRAPMAAGFISKSGQEYIPDLISEKGIRETGIFNFESVRKLLTKVQSGIPATEIENMALCAILSTQILMHQYVLKDAFRPAERELRNCRIIDERK